MMEWVRVICIAGLLGLAVITQVHAVKATRELDKFSMFGLAFVLFIGAVYLLRHWGVQP